MAMSIRRLEACGAEAWLSGLSEWIWYSNSEEEHHLLHDGRRYSPATLNAKLRATSSELTSMLCTGCSLWISTAMRRPKTPATFFGLALSIFPTQARKVRWSWRQVRSTTYSGVGWMGSST